MKKFATIFFMAGIAAVAQSASVQITLREQDKPIPGAMIILQRLKDGDCAKLFNSKHLSAKNQKKAESCMTDLPEGSTDTYGSYLYQQLSPGFYDVRLLWSMRNPPSPDRAIACMAKDWGVFYEPGRDRTGKYDAMAQGRPFELKESEVLKISFDYRGQFEGRDCFRH